MNQTNNTKSYQPLPNIPADIEISQKAEMKPIQDIASKLNLNEEMEMKSPRDLRKELLGEKTKKGVDVASPMEQSTSFA